MALPEVDGFRATQDLSELSEQELAHHVINGVIWLAERRGESIERILESMLGSHIVAKVLIKMLEEGRFEGLA